jgi:citrate lyase subunit beta / citryl-CoA lyase
MTDAAARSWLFVPADSSRKIEKALSSSADALILDLEDSVSPDAKVLARMLVRQTLAQAHASTSQQLWVRVNPSQSAEHVQDLVHGVSAGLAGIMLPKALPEEISQLSDRLDVLEAKENLTNGSIKIIAIVTETAQATLSIPAYQPHPRLVALTWGSEDLSADLGASAKTDAAGVLDPAFRLAQTLCLLGATRLGCAAIDQIHADFQDTVGLEAACKEACRQGFIGKMAIHPNQVASINQLFSPAPEAIAQAKAIVAAFAAAPGAGVVSLAGKMLDLPHLRLAQRVLARAAA